MGRPEIPENVMTLTAALTVLVVVFSQFFYYQATAFPKPDVKTEQQDTPDEHPAYVSIQSTSLPSSTLVVLHQTMFFLFEICFVGRESEQARPHIPWPPNRFFKTLFDSVISPNAP
jgi:hypothetical protein